MSPDDQPYPSDPADLFLRLYGDLDEDVIYDDLVEEWWDDDGVQEFAAYVQGELLTAGTFDSDHVVELVDEFPDGVDQRRYAFLLGLDWALATVHRLVDGSDQGGPLMPLAQRYLRTGMLNKDPRLGALLPRVVRRPGLEHTDPPDWEHKADLFCAVTCVSPEHWQEVRSVRVPRIDDVPPSARLDGVTVACAPVCGRSDVDIARMPGGTRAAYRIRPRVSEELEERIRSIVGALDATDAQIAVMPELTLDPAVLEHWQRALRDHPVARGSRVRLILAGTGPFPADRAHAVHNRAILLARDGRVVAEQDKRHGFTLTADIIRDWGLSEDLGGESLAEPIVRSKALTVLESHVGRVCMLICEDLACSPQDGERLAQIGPSHILAPVLSKPTLPHYWEHSDAKKWATSVGASTVVANSHVIEEAMRAAGVPGEDGEGTALAHSPTGGFAHDYAEDPDSLVVLRLAPEETVVVRRVTRV